MDCFVADAPRNDENYEATFVYILASRRNGTLYVGVTSNLPRRIWEHRNAVLRGFTARYSCKMLVWYELHSTMENAIVREKQLKAGSRKKKLALIEKTNPAWRDLYDELI
ncbi:MAG TPA: GIY-YIG nuclease family protein [Xanthobacteraceae bacterium]|nr:GIY-YIG nuclease family protein [Xanthobacteraceae bacterium]